MNNPSFFVVGTQKAATTALHDWLVQQPDVCLPTIKETHFFSHAERFDRGLHWYQKQFPRKAGEVVMGEIDPEYMFVESAPLRLRALVSAPKIVFILRHPLERAYSHYLMSVRRGYENLPFVDALLAEPSRLAVPNNEFAMDHFSYMKRGRYCEQIERYHTVFPDAGFLYVTFEDLVGSAKGGETYESICKFVGVRSAPSLANRDKKSNQSSMPKSLFLRNFLYGKSVLKKLLGKLIRSEDAKLRLAMFLDKVNQKPASGRFDISEHHFPSGFVEALTDDIRMLETLTGLNLFNWINRFPGTVK